jgi:NapC/NirT cytochrome c family, N-terminal region
VGEKKITRLFNNWMSFTGFIIAAMSGIAILFFIFISIASATANPYLGILMYLVLPAFLVAGFLLLLTGMYIEWKRQRKQGDTTFIAWPKLDLNLPKHRRTLLIFLFGTMLFVLISSVGMYQTYHFSESVQFCGLTCHTVMKPEYTAYQYSPHARVKCVECHIGPGAEWFVRSKLSGLYQVYAVAVSNYPRPIATPIKNLRPAQTICEQCHWPEKFFGATQWQFDHYIYDKSNTHWPINILVKTGGGNPRTSQTSGIHWHMNIGFKIEYIARDKQRQDIPWVRATNKQTGLTTVYQDSTNPLLPESSDMEKPRIMDCIDCHSRPSHEFRSPDHEIDLALVMGQIDPALPEIKKVAVEALTGEYKSEEDALKGIERTLSDFYQANYPTVNAQKSQAIHKSIRASQEAYVRNFFPAMKARWSDYPNNIGHFNFRGCMRCHDGKHTSGNGTIIANNCRYCHIILSQGAGKRGKIINNAGLDFIHPIDIGPAWKEGNCYDCHRGTQP